MHLLSPAAESRVLEIAGLPRWPADADSPLWKKVSPAGCNHFTQRPMRIGIVNEFSSGLGDTIVLMGAVREFRARAEERFGAVHIDLLQHPHYLEADALWDSSGLVDRIVHLPVALSALRPYTYCYKVGVQWTSVDRKTSEGRPWIDEMLCMLGVDPDSVPRSNKRSNGLIQPVRFDEVADAARALRHSPRRLLLFHHLASTPIRSMASEMAERLVRDLISSGEWLVISACPLDVHDRWFVDWSKYSTSFSTLAFILSQVDAFVSVDTSVYHLGDAIGVPGVVLFSSIAPAERIAYYPGIEGILVGGHDNKILGLHSTHDPDLVAYAQHLWSGVDASSIMDRLSRVAPHRA